jgi:hypothetical protein
VTAARSGTRAAPRRTVLGIHHRARRYAPHQGTPIPWHLCHKAMIPGRDGGPAGTRTWGRRMS